MRYLYDSATLAESVLSDARERLKAGQGSELDVLEAQSGLALRKTKQNDARQGFYDALGRVQMLSGTSPAENGPTLRAVDTPPPAKAEFSYRESFEMAFRLNPEYLVQAKKVDQEELKVGVARNQLLPELNLKGAFGFNGLGLTPGSSWDTVDSGKYPSWSVGIELHVPIAGNIKGRNQLGAAHLSLQEAIVNLNSIQTQIANALNTAILKARSAQGSVQSYQTVVGFNEDLLKTQLARLNVGKVEPRKVLEVEADLFDARQSLAEALVHYERILLEMELATGSVLQHRNLDLTQAELRRKTASLLRHRSLPTGAFSPFPADPTPSLSK
jgi:outer membrane protein TolC